MNHILILLVAIPILLPIAVQTPNACNSIISLRLLININFTNSGSAWIALQFKQINKLSGEKSDFR